MAKKKEDTKKVELKEVSRVEINGNIIITYEDGSVKIIPAPIMLTADQASEIFGSEEDEDEEEEEESDDDEDEEESEDDEDEDDSEEEDEEDEDEDDELSDEPAKESESDDIDYQTEFKKLIGSPIKANGMEITVDSVDDAIRLMQMGMGYSRKMEELKPARQVIAMLENNGLMDTEKLNFANSLWILIH